MLMTKLQFRRLLLVIIIPLLAFGWWLAESELAFNHHHLTTCMELDARFSCRSKLVSKQYKRDAIWGNRPHPRIYINDALLVADAPMHGTQNAEIVTLGFEDTVKYVLPDLKETAITSQFVGRSEKFLNIDAMVRAKFGGRWDYQIFPFKSAKLDVVGSNGIWSLLPKFPANEYVNFRFVNSDTNDKYYDAWELIKAETDRFVTISRWIYACTVFVPLIAFLIFSLFVLVCSKLATFIIHGKKENTPHDIHVET